MEFPVVDPFCGDLSQTAGSRTVETLTDASGRAGGEVKAEPFPPSQRFNRGNSRCLVEIGSCNPLVMTRVYLSHTFDA